MIKNFLATVLKNISGSRMTFSFLPPHGQTLDDDEEIEIPGDVVAAIGRSARNPSRKIAAYFAALDDSLLSVVSTPSPVLVDTVAGTSLQLKITSGTPGSEAPSYASLTD